MAGIVEAIGEGVTNFKPGDEVYGMTGGIAAVHGSLAEYAAVDEDLLAIKPNISNLALKRCILNSVTPLDSLTNYTVTGGTLKRRLKEMAAPGKNDVFTSL